MNHSIKCHYKWLMERDSRLLQNKTNKKGQQSFSFYLVFSVNSGSLRILISSDWSTLKEQGGHKNTLLKISVFKMDFLKKCIEFSSKWVFLRPLGIIQCKPQLTFSDNHQEYLWDFFFLWITIANHCRIILDFLCLLLSIYFKLLPYCITILHHTFLKDPSQTLCSPIKFSLFKIIEETKFRFDRTIYLFY